MNSEPDNTVTAVARNLLAARAVVVLSGSGMSAESGIPTFRDAQTGVWANYRPEDLATPAAFARDPARVWRWYETRRARIQAARPHAGHAALVALEALAEEFTIVTQNVDGLHQLAGSGRVLELHGNILRSVCSATGREIADDWIRESSDVPPRSPFTEDGLARPGVVWFGEALPEEVLQAAMDALRTCDICITVGTSALVEPAASLPLVAQERGAMLIEINPDSTPLSLHADYRLRLPAQEALTAVLTACGDPDSGE